MADRIILGCKPVSWVSEGDAAKTGSTKANCQSCGTAVWVVPRNFVIIEQNPGSSLLCLPCAHKETPPDAQILPARPEAERLGKFIHTNRTLTTSEAAEEWDSVTRPPTGKSVPLDG